MCAEVRNGEMILCRRVVFCLWRRMRRRMMCCYGNDEVERTKMMKGCWGARTMMKVGEVMISCQGMICVMGKRSRGNVGREKGR